LLLSRTESAPPDPGPDPGCGGPGLDSTSTGPHGAPSTSTATSTHDTPFAQRSLRTTATLIRYQELSSVAAADVGHPTSPVLQELLPY
jgi:hypothetical protein